MHRHPPRRGERGLTTVGLAFLLGVGAGLVFVGYLAVTNEMCAGGSKIKTTQLKIGNVKSAVNTYYATTGHYPHGFDELLEPPEDMKPMLESHPRDEWGRPLDYRLPWWSEAPFEIRSAGADGVFGTDDDISSIRRSPGATPDTRDH